VIEQELVPGEGIGGGSRVDRRIPVCRGRRGAGPGHVRIGRLDRIGVGDLDLGDLG